MRSSYVRCDACKVDLAHDSHYANVRVYGKRSSDYGDFCPLCYRYLADFVAQALGRSNAFDDVKIEVSISQVRLYNEHGTYVR